MSDAGDRLAALLARWSKLEGIQPSPVPGVSCIKVSRSQEAAKRPWRASFCIVARGIKELALEGQRYREREPHYIVSPIDLPVTSRVTGASPARPFLGLKLDFDARALRDVAAQVDRSQPDVPDRLARAIFLGRAPERMLEAAVRLCELFATPGDAAVLAPLIVRELFYHLLVGPDGPAIRQLARAGSQAQRVAAAIHHLQASLADDADIAGLARAAGMSRAAFFKRFKEATAMSPLQYQKRLRLLEARRLMLDEGEGAEAAAFRVGYASPSQFSREYSRMFGNAPLRDTRTLRRTSSVIAEL
ncbi:MAG: AraC family transcriptional regulator [Deltaproteobacteria bacterium]|nr:AraC family transcriptional regulator [Deltaproteobacteria bacterium]